MSSSNGSTVENLAQNFCRRSAKGGCTKGNWSGINIAAMVIGFVFFWPVGLVILYWNIRGRDVRDLPSAIQTKWADMFQGSRPHKSSSENSVFDEFQQTQHDRISEIKDEIKHRAKNFKNYRADAKRRKDEKEFDNFMSSKPERDDNQ